MVLVSAGALVAGAVLVFLALPREPSAGDELLVPQHPYPAELVDGDVVGAAEAPVVIELYADFQCPACQLFVTERLARLVSEFVMPRTVRIEAKDIDILGQGTQSESLALAVGARCAAEQDRYWQFHDIVFWNQGRENRGDHDAAFIARVADAAELDRTTFDACIARADIRAAIREQTAAALGAGISSTPTLLVNGQPVVGVPEYEQLAALIRQLAAQATPAAP
jgi:protein-disulfide isomerase